MWPREKVFADSLTAKKIKWVYQPKRFDLGNTTYTPDFFLPSKKMYVEVVGSHGAFKRGILKINRLKQLYPKIKLLVLDYKGNPYPYKKGIKLYAESTENATSVKISIEQYERIKKFAKKHDKCVIAIIRSAIEKYLKG